MRIFSASALDRLNPIQGGVRGMRIIATGLLVVMAVIYLVARAYEPQHPGLGYVRAFAEAAMVGGLADWFAVTALFRHPLGLPIPHTAIIPRNKDRIGDSLALFLRDNFLTPSVVARRMRGIDVAAALGRWLSSPGGNSGVREGARRLLGDVVEALADDRLGGMVKGAVVSRLRGVNIAPVLGQALAAAVGEDRHVPVLDGLLRWADQLLTSSEDMIRQLVHDRANPLLRWTGLDERIADAIVDGLKKLVGDMADDPHHPLRLKIEEGLQKLASDLGQDAAMQDRVGRLRDALIDNPAIAAWFEGMWQALRTGIVRAVRNPELTGGRMGDAMRQLGETLLEDQRLRVLLNRFVRRATVGAVASYGDGIVALVSDTIRGWDARTVTHRVEAAVGRDMQYIRINGTLVGGLVGLFLHLIGELL